MALAGQDLGEGGLAGAVAADQPDLVAGGDPEGDVVHEQACARADLEMVDGDHGSNNLDEQTEGTRTAHGQERVRAQSVAHLMALVYGLPGPGADSAGGRVTRRTRRRAGRASHGNAPRTGTPPPTGPRTEREASSMRYNPKARLDSSQVSNRRGGGGGGGLGGGFPMGGGGGGGLKVGGGIGGVIVLVIVFLLTSNLGVAPPTRAPRRRRPAAAPRSTSAAAARTPTRTRTAPWSPT